MNVDVRKYPELSGFGFCPGNFGDAKCTMIVQPSEFL
jgi:hypothetical protein